MPATSTKASRPPGDHGLVYPTSIRAPWQDISTAPQTVEADAGVVVSGVVVNPLAIAAGGAASWLALEPGGTQVALRLKYPVAASVTIAPIVRLCTQDENGVPGHAIDSGGATTVTLAPVPATDIRDNASPQFAYSEPALVDCLGAAKFLAAIERALAGTGITGATIQAQVM